MDKTTGKAFYERQVDCLARRDLDGLMNQYRDDATIVGFDFTVKGKPAIRRHFEGYLGRLGQITLKSTDKFTETEDSIFFEATVLTALGEARVYDVFLLEEGKASHHFTGLISVTPSQVPAAAG